MLSPSWQIMQAMTLADRNVPELVAKYPDVDPVEVRSIYIEEVLCALRHGAAKHQHSMALPESRERWLPGHEPWGGPPISAE